MEVKAGYKKKEGISIHWETKPLGDVAEVIMGQSPPGTTYNQCNDGTPLINGPTEFTEKYPIKIQWTTQPTKICQDGDLLLCVRGSSTGRMNVSNDKYCIGRGVAAIRAKPGADTTFLTYQIFSAIQDLLSFSAGSTFPNVDRKAIRSISILLPPLPEQRTIATALSDVDALITSLDKLIAKKRDIKQAAMQELLTGKRRLSGFNGKWNPLNMADKSQLKARIGWQGLTTAEYLKTGDYYLVTGTDFLNGHINWENCCFVDEVRYSQDKNIQLKQGDILLTKDGTIGKVGFVDFLPGPAALNSGVFVIRSKNLAYDHKFFYYVLTSNIFDEFLSKLQAGSTISHLYQKDFINFSFIAPDIPEQTAIATILSDMDADLAALEQKRDKTKAIKQGMMQELLTGRIRLV
jgi:type I restriction enzyme S subunit